MATTNNQRKNTNTSYACYAAAVLAGAGALLLAKRAADAQGTKGRIMDANVIAGATRGAEYGLEFDGKNVKIAHAAMDAGDCKIIACKDIVQEGSIGWNFSNSLVGFLPVFHTKTMSDTTQVSPDWKVVFGNAALKVRWQQDKLPTEVLEFDTVDKRYEFLGWSEVLKSSLFGVVGIHHPFDRTKTHYRMDNTRSRFVYGKVETRYNHADKAMVPTLQPDEKGVIIVTKLSEKEVLQNYRNTVLRNVAGTLIWTGVSAASVWAGLNNRA